MIEILPNCFIQKHLVRGARITPDNTRQVEVGFYDGVVITKFDHVFPTEREAFDWLEELVEELS